jgi:hypothetical protein
MCCNKRHYSKLCTSVGALIRRQEQPLKYIAGSGQIE